MPIKPPVTTSVDLFRQRFNGRIPRLMLPKAQKSSGCYAIHGNSVYIGPGCIFVGTPKQTVESLAFEVCAPFIMHLGKNKKHVFGHIDATTTWQEIVDIIKTHFAPKEIEAASYHYFRGAESLHGSEKLGQHALNTIKRALKELGVKGHYHGKLDPSGLDIVRVDSEGIKIIRNKEVEQQIDP